MKNTSGARGGAKRFYFSKKLVGYTMLFPFAALFLVFVLLPVILSIFYSFFDYDMMKNFKFTGLDNYVKLFTTDDVFLISMKNTAVFSLIVGPIGFIMSFMFGWVVNNLKGSRAFALAFYAPSITGGVAVSTVWAYFFSSDRLGFINNFLLRAGMITTPVLWRNDPTKILFVIIVVSLWMSMGVGFLTNLAGLKNISGEIYEAAYVDGLSGRFKELYYITVPMMKPQLLFNAVMAIVNSMSVFDISANLVGYPSPEYSGHTLVAHLYDYAAIRLDLGYASGIAVVLFVIMFVFSRICTRMFSSKDE